MEQSVKTVLWLDDIRNPFDADFIPYVNLYNPLIKERHKITWVLNYTAFVKYITENGLPDAICFDHDLADEHYEQKEEYSEKTGLDCAKWLVEYCARTQQELPLCVCHSANPVGKANILHHLEWAHRNLGV